MSWLHGAQWPHWTSDSHTCAACPIDPFEWTGKQLHDLLAYNGLSTHHTA